MNVRRAFGLLQLSVMTMVGAVAAAGCDDGCLEGSPCIDIDAIRSSRVGVSLSPDGAGNERVGLGIDLPPPVQPGDCYRLADDLEIRANGSTGEGVDLRADAGDDHVFYGPCAGEGQFARTWFTVSAAPELLTITFSKEGDQVALDIQRPQPQPVDVVLQDDRARSGVDVHRRAAAPRRLAPRGRLLERHDRVGARRRRSFARAGGGDGVGGPPHDQFSRRARSFRPVRRGSGSARASATVASHRPPSAAPASAPVSPLRIRGVRSDRSTSRCCERSVAGS